MNDKHRARLKKFGDKLAADKEVVAHVVTVWYKNGDTENNWSGMKTGKVEPGPFLLEDSGGKDDAD